MGERSNVEEKDLRRLLRGVARKYSSLEGRAVYNGLIGIDALIGLLPVEKVRYELDDLRYTYRPAN